MGVRIDKWLWFTRFYKTRALASRAVGGGHVHVNGRRVKPAHAVSDGDVVDVTKAQQRFRVTVVGEPHRRGPAVEAVRYYLEDAESIAAREQMQRSLRLDRAFAPRTDGRPDKHTRRKLRERRQRH